MLVCFCVCDVCSKRDELVVRLKREAYASMVDADLVFFFAPAFCHAMWALCRSPDDGRRLQSAEPVGFGGSRS